MCLSLEMSRRETSIKRKKEKKNGFMEINKISTYCDIPNKEEASSFHWMKKKMVLASLKSLSSSGSQTSLMFHLNPILMIFSSLSFYTSED